MTKNLLSGETSPYLLQHKDNPVHWFPWGDQAFQQAKEQDKPILLSIGYAACHWCHVMAHESFEDDGVAEVMNRDFINIKVDREERPDVDKIYMDAIHSLGEHGGWPLNMFLAPDGTPFWGGTYFPKDPKYGRPGFVHVLNEISRIWCHERQKVTANQQALREALSRPPAPPSGTDLTRDHLHEAAEIVVGATDMHNGGLRGAPKFPQGSMYEFLWRLYCRTGNSSYRAAVETTMRNICQGGIYDHLGGGMARYAVDDLWLVPHFEKMLYDNAQFISLLAKIHARTGDILFRTRIEETIDWTIREMRTDEGAFASSFDADSEGQEGKFYVWDESSVDALLSEDSATQFKSVYDITKAGNWEGTNIPNRLQNQGMFDVITEGQLANARAVLFEHRKSRIPPGWDDKVLADWNGLMIEAMAEAGLKLGRSDWTGHAEQAFDAVLKLLWNRDSGLSHSYRDGKTRNNATADGYANLIAAAIALHQATTQSRFLETAQQLEKQLTRQCWDTGNGGFYFSSDQADNLIVRPRFGHDDATPNANATMLEAYSKLAILTGNPYYADQAEKLIAAFQNDIQRNVIGYASFLSAFDQFTTPVQCVLAGPIDSPETMKLRDAILSAADPSVTFVYVEDTTSLPADHPASGKSSQSGKTVLYLCRGQTCSLPVSEPNAVAGLFAQS